MTDRINNSFTKSNLWIVRDFFPSCCFYFVSKIYMSFNKEESIIDVFNNITAEIFPVENINFSITLVKSTNNYSVVQDKVYVFCKE